MGRQVKVTRPVLPGVGEYRAVTELSSAQILALNSTPVVLIPAAPAGYAVVPDRALAIYRHGGSAYAGIAAGEDLNIRYSNETDVLFNIETTGFLDQTSDQARLALLLADVSVRAARAVEVVLGGAITSGNGTLRIEAFYHIYRV